MTSAVIAYHSEMTDKTFIDIPAAFTLAELLPVSFLFAGIAVVIAVVVRIVLTSAYKKEQAAIKESEQDYQKRLYAARGIGSRKLREAIQQEYTVNSLATPENFSKPMNGFNYLIVIAVAAVVTFAFTLAFSGFAAVENSRAESNAEFREWVYEEYDIKLTPTEAALLRGGGKDAYVESSYKGFPVDLSVKQVATSSNGSTEWVLMYRDGAQPLYLFESPIQD